MDPSQVKGGLTSIGPSHPSGEGIEVHLFQYDWRQQKDVVLFQASAGATLFGLLDVVLEVSEHGCLLVSLV
jgi:hypothetical protein